MLLQAYTLTDGKYKAEKSGSRDFKSCEGAATSACPAAACLPNCNAIFFSLFLHLKKEVSLVENKGLNAIWIIAWWRDRDQVRLVTGEETTSKCCVLWSGIRAHQHLVLPMYDHCVDISCLKTLPVQKMFTG